MVMATVALGATPMKTVMAEWVLRHRACCMLVIPYSTEPRILKATVAEDHTGIGEAVWFDKVSPYEATVATPDEVSTGHYG